MCVVVCAVAMSGVTARAQSTMHSIRIRAIGGFLGQIEGFCEDKGGPYDWGTATPDPCLGAHEGAGWLGGILGALRKIPPGDPANPYDIVAITSNNQPVTSEAQFYGYLRALRPTVVGLGGEDFDRNMRGPSASAKGLADFVAGNPDLPLLASNVVIKHEASHLNTIASGPFRLRIPRDESVAWTRPIAIEPSPPIQDTALVSFDACPANARPSVGGHRERASVRPNTDGTGATLDITGGLQPGRCYRLQLTDATARTGTFWITTDSALTPRRNALARYDGLPLIATPDGDLLIVNAIDPSVRLRAAESAWKWRDEGVEHEIQIAKPVDYFDALFEAIARDGDANLNAPAGAQPLVVLLSSATDATTLEILEKFPQIRFVVLDPESRLLGRTAAQSREGRMPAYGGDLGFTGLADVVYPTATKIFVRPDWFGETLVTASARVRAERLDWIMEAPQVKVDVVEGATFDWRTGTKVTYHAMSPGGDILVGEAPPYVDCPRTNDPTPRCNDFVNLWSSQKTVAAMLGDAIRQESHADLAVVSAAIVDEDFTPWVSRMIAAANHDATWVSKYILVRLVYAAPRMVRAYVPGSELPAVVRQIHEDSDMNCVSGLGGMCVNGDADHPSRITVKGRRLDRRLFYSFVMADALAEKLGLAHDDAHALLDPIDAADKYLQRGDWYVAQLPGGPALPARVEQRANRRHSAYLAFTRLDFGWSKVVVKDPSARGPVEASVIRANLRQLDYAGAQASQTTAWAIDADFAPWDQASYAIRLPVLFDYARRRQADSVSYDKDQLSFGARYDQKLHVLGELRLFGGAFVDGPFHDQKGSVVPTRTVSSDGAPITLVESPSTPTPFAFEPSRYIHGAVGAEVTGYGELSVGGVKFRPTVLGGRWAYGPETRIPTGVTLAGDPLDFVVFTRAGTKAALDKYFDEHRLTFRAGEPLRVENSPRMAHRPQLDAQGTIAVAHGARTFVTDLAIQLRFYRYPGADAELFALRNTQKYDVRLSTPLVGRFNLVPHLVYQRASVTTATTKPFQYVSFEIGISAPFLWRWGQGQLIR